MCPLPTSCAYAEGVLTFCNEQVSLEEVDEEARRRWAEERGGAERAAEEEAGAAVQAAEKEEKEQEEQRQREARMSLFAEQEQDHSERPSPAEVGARVYREAMAAWEESVRGGADPTRWTEGQRRRKLSIRGTWVGGRLQRSGVLRKGGREREAEWEEGQCAEVDLTRLPGLRAGCTARFASSQPSPAVEDGPAEEAAPSSTPGPQSLRAPRTEHSSAEAEGAVATSTPAPAGEAAFAFDGAHYHGEWRRYTPHGHGTLSFSDGSVYEGDLAGFRAEGSGRLARPNGTVLQGRWRDSVPSGWARLQEYPQRVLAGRVTATEGAESR